MFSLEVSGPDHGAVRAAAAGGLRILTRGAGAAPLDSAPQRDGKELKSYDNVLWCGCSLVCCKHGVPYQKRYFLPRATGLLTWWGNNGCLSWNWLGALVFM